MIEYKTSVVDRELVVDLKGGYCNTKIVFHKFLNSWLMLAGPIRTPRNDFKYVRPEHKVELYTPYNRTSVLRNLCILIEAHRIANASESNIIFDSLLQDVLNDVDFEKWTFKDLEVINIANFIYNDWGLKLDD